MKTVALLVISTLCALAYAEETVEDPFVPIRPRECISHGSLNQPNRAWSQGNSPLLCDRNLRAGWYRINGLAGNNMPTHCVPKNRCSTHASGWFQGRLPTNRYQLVRGTACFHWSNNCCHWKRPAKVRNCGGFNVYYLTGTVHCHLRYCGNRNAPPPPPPECRNYRWLNQANRAQSQGNSPTLCDRNLPSHWYRFGGLAGNNMPTRCVPRNRCSTHASGWFQGRLPTQRYQLVSGTACFHWTSGCCSWRRPVKVRNCGGFNVYYLIGTPACSLRYCGNRNVLPSECRQYRWLNEANRATSQGNNPLLCDNHLPTAWYRFGGLAGNNMPTYCVPKNRCSTHASGWLQGGLPTNFQRVKRRVCFHWLSNCCHWKRAVEVTNCGGFNIYRLGKPPVCHLRYCGNRR